MTAKLIFVAGSRQGLELELPSSGLTFGRAPDQDFVFEPSDDLVSGRHAAIRFENGRYVVHDERSTNGTFVNNRRVQSQQLEDGDVVEFGLGGPSARFMAPQPAGSFEPTRPRADAGEPGKVGTVTRLLNYAQQQSGGSGRPTIVMKEFVRLAYERSARRTRRIALMIAIFAGLLVGGVWWNAERGQAEANAQLQALSAGLFQERSSRDALAAELARIQGQYGELRENYSELQVRYGALEREQIAQRREIERDQRFGETVTRTFSNGVAYLHFAWGLAARNGGEFLRARLDANGAVVWQVDAQGDSVPELVLGGAGPIYPAGIASGTGFLIDRAGWVLTNRHIGAPWAGNAEWESYLETGRELGLEPRFAEFLAFFPSIRQPFRMEVEAISGEADVALLRSIDGGIDAPVLPVAPPDVAVRAGQPVVNIGYPTGLMHMIARLDDEVREQLVTNARSNRELAHEMASRGLIYPVVSIGHVSDVSLANVAYTGSTTGGSSGGPIFGPDRRVVAIHYASEIVDPSGRFVPRLAAPIRHAWVLAPPELRQRLAGRR